MTDKEQIMIDGVNVGGCKYLNTFSDCDGYHYYCDLADDIKNEYCEHYKGCYFKQLARKTQECGELKKQFETSEEWRIKAEGLNEKLDLKNTRYRKALEEIEGLISDDEFIRCPINDDVNCNYFTRNKILNIINKAKGENKNE